MKYKARKMREQIDHLEREGRHLDIGNEFLDSVEELKNIYKMLPNRTPLDYASDLLILGLEIEYLQSVVKEKKEKRVARRDFDEWKVE